MLTELKKIDKDSDRPAYDAIKETWQITPATSDLVQASFTVLEMHSRGARWTGAGAIAPHAAVGECASRIPIDKVRSMNPAKAEEWLVERLGISKVAGKIESNGIDGRQLLKVANMAQKDAAAALGVKMAVAKAPQLAIWRNMSTPSDAMHEKITALLEKALAVAVGERPSTAAAVLRMLGARPSKRSINVSDAIGGTSLPAAATAPVSEHSDETVAATLGGCVLVMT